jgi:predicted GNAT family N-acyltransferase
MIQYINASTLNKDGQELRKKVFILEQKIDPKLEFDANDYLDSTIIRGAFVHHYLYDGDTLIAYARSKIEHSLAHIGRFCVDASYRKKGYGRILLEKIEGYLNKNNHITSFTLNAQVQAKGFYQACGYQARGRIFLEANIQHQKMTKEIILK